MEEENNSTTTKPYDAEIQKMKVVVFGSTGGTGRQLVEQALEEGHRVTALARHPEKFPMQHEHLRIVQGDVLDSDCVVAAVSGQDAVMSALGTKQRGPVSICTDGIKRILTAMTTHGVRRLVAISAYGAADSHRQDLYNFFLWTFMKQKMIDKEHMEELIKQSGLDWTVVRPAALTDGPRTQRYHTGTDLHMKLSSKISRADVADFMLRQLTDATYVHKAPAIAA